MEKKIVNRCGGKKSGCTLEEYIIPYGQTQVQSGKRKTDKTIGQKPAGQ